jgi:hypothetical protein
MSQGRTDTMFKWGVFSTIIVLISFAIGLRSGVEGVALAYTIATCLLAYPSFAIPFRLNRPESEALLSTVPVNHTCDAHARDYCHPH